MTLEEADKHTRESMQAIGNIVKVALPDKWGFVVLAFPFGSQFGRRMNYVSNANGDDVVKAMKEFIEKTEGQWGKRIE